MKGEISCPRCDETGTVNVASSENLGGTIDMECPDCKGEGIVVCPDCGGEGVITKDRFDASGHWTSERGCETCADSWDLN